MPGNPAPRGRPGPIPFREVNQAISGAQAAKEVGLPRAQERSKFACPSCDSSDALHAYVRPGGGAYCFSCNTKFSVVDLAAAAWGKTPVDACLGLAKRFGIESGPFRARNRRIRSTMEPHPPQGRTAGAGVSTDSESAEKRRIRAEVYGTLIEDLPLGERAHCYLKCRGINSGLAFAHGFRSLESSDEWKELGRNLWKSRHPQEIVVAGFAYRPGGDGPPRPWVPWWGGVPALLIPYCSRAGQVEAIRFRRMTSGDPRYMAPIGAGAGIPWGAEALEGPRPLELVVTEGEIDALTLLQTGYEAIALGGATPSRALLTWTVEALEDVTSLALWTDSDPAGEGAVNRLAQHLAERFGWPWVEERVSRWRSEMDANDLARSGELR